MGDFESVGPLGESTRGGRVNWRVFPPGVVMLSLAWGPLFLVPLLLQLFHVDAMGFGMAWGLVIALPLTIIGGLTLIGGVSR